eukprot:CAMPEP_0184687646 /NCGR_PEP_ID=MMETSP0312-20130426/27207_1 /TAXON_ID=31354 /ORGANISM="Compsopogon coeruleus, Strain SAG 36.94" /LENGTH=415 /DNA_ID=CAMNT_0027144019 /DNA_START=52 /DNA_END=1302 /DNA_ORIENTATION=+
MEVKGSVGLNEVVVPMDGFSPEVGMDDLPPELVMKVLEGVIGVEHPAEWARTMIDAETWRDARGLVTAASWVRDLFYRNVGNVRLNFGMTELDIPSVLFKCPRLHGLVLERAVGVKKDSLDRDGLKSSQLSTSPKAIDFMVNHEPERIIYLKSLTLSYCYQINDGVLASFGAARSIEDLRIMACSGISWRGVWNIVCSNPVRKLVYCPARMVSDVDFNGVFLGSLDRSRVEDLSIGALSVPEGWLEENFHPSLIQGLVNVRKFRLSGIQARDLSAASASVFAQLPHLTHLKFNLVGLPMKDELLAEFMSILATSDSIRTVEFFAFSVGNLATTASALGQAIGMCEVDELEDPSSDRDVNVRFLFEIANRECNWKVSKTEIMCYTKKSRCMVKTSVKTSVDEEYVAKYVRHDSPWA